MPIGKIIKEGAKLVKRGRKSKRGRPKKKVEVKKKQVVKRTDPNKITRLKGESDASFKKRKAAIKSSESKKNNKLLESKCAELQKDNQRLLSAIKKRRNI